MKNFCLTLSVAFILVLTVLLGVGNSNLPEAVANPVVTAMENSLPPPSNMPLQDYEKVLYEFILRREYATNLKWCVDKGVRDTGPFIQGKYYGIHPAARIYYSPRVMYWLTGNPDYWHEGKASGAAQPKKPREGLVPDGGMIVKEMFKPPAVLYKELKNDPKYQNNPVAYETLISQLIEGWTVMVKDSKGSKDGWFWANPGARKEEQSIEQAIAGQLDDYTHSLYSGFGVPCLRCHASAEKELTFSSLDNIEGFDGEPLQFRVDNSWRTESLLEEYPLSLLADDKYAKTMFNLPPSQRPWTDESILDWLTYIDPHIHPVERYAPELTAEALPSVNPEFVATFPQTPGVASADVKAFPPQWADHVVPSAQGPEQYITSDNCLGCHGGLGGAPYGVTMFVKTGPKYGEGYNVSEYGEWRWSPMGLAGRDPIFHAQLESEMAILEKDAKAGDLLKGSLEENKKAVRNTCLSCHGAMGQRQLELDAKSNNNLNPDFKVEYFYLTEKLSSTDPTPPDYQYHKYGELAREGISCTVCHHISPPNPAEVAGWNPPGGWLSSSKPETKELAYLLFHNSTGQYETSPPDELNGPFEKVAEFPMKTALGITPKHNPFTKDSQMCGTCHTINLPNIGATEDKFPVLTKAEQNPTLKPYYHTIEQATFLEWQNSAFGRPGQDFKSCQDCHMPGGFKTLAKMSGKDSDEKSKKRIDIPQLVTQIATIQDTYYPAAEHAAPSEDIEILPRPDYTRHEHVGLNVFLLEMFDQFPSILGVDETDYMTSATTGNALALENMVRQAREDTVGLKVDVESFQNNQLTANVTVTNKTGHRLPSGVAFRRVFLEFLVLNGNDVVWGSGRTNSVGVIVDGKGKPLKTEFLPDAKTYQPHYQKITREDEVQIYEELNQNRNKEFTTSFIHRVEHIKDNRLLPKGWRDSKFFKDQGKVIFEFMEATDPKNVYDDVDYKDQGPNFLGQDNLQYVVTLPAGLDATNLTVKVTMYSQAIPPYWLHQRFTLAPNGDATKRLYYLASHLNLKGTVMEDWKLPLVSATCTYDATKKPWVSVPAP